MLPLLMAALGIITDRNSTDYWYQAKALPALTVCLSFSASFHNIVIYVVIPELLRFVPGFLGTRVSTNLDFQCLPTSEAEN